MLFAGWEVRIVKNCDRGLENAARGRRPRAAFSRPRLQFFTIRTDPKPVNNLFIFFFWVSSIKSRTSANNCCLSVLSLTCSCLPVFSVFTFSSVAMPFRAVRLYEVASFCLKSLSLCTENCFKFCNTRTKTSRKRYRARGQR